MKPMHIDARPLAAAMYDGIALAIAAFAAAALLDANGLGIEKLELLVGAFAIAIPIQIAVNVFFGIYQGVWRYTSLPDIQRVVFAVLAGTVCISAALGAAGLEGALACANTSCTRCSWSHSCRWRAWASARSRSGACTGAGGEQGTPVVIMGAGDAAVGLLKEMSRSPEWRVVGLLDDDEKKLGRLLHGVRVIGALDDLPRFAQRLKVRHAIIAMPSVRYNVAAAWWRSASARACR
jgi:FlaA1/EpsC-like NDP-sugar epimerase